MFIKVEVSDSLMNSIELFLKKCFVIIFHDWLLFLGFIWCPVINDLPLLTQPLPTLQKYWQRGTIVFTEIAIVK